MPWCVFQSAYSIMISAARRHARICGPSGGYPSAPGVERDGSSIFRVVTGKRSNQRGSVVSLALSIQSPGFDLDSRQVSDPGNGARVPAGHWAVLGDRRHICEVTDNCCVPWGHTWANAGRACRSKATRNIASPQKLALPLNVGRYIIGLSITTC
jgi:hypothetical protein